jgi:meso-butanediol dehydrogenase / (S,S)-butanediol dehydrogenase / diacetyl reductase
MLGELSGKVIVLTGGAAGSGHERATSYVREGAAVALLDRDGEKAAQTAAELGSDCIAVQVDVGEVPAVEAAFHAVLLRYGKLEAVHNNAGIAGPSKPLHQTAEHEWDELKRVKVKSVLWTTRFALDALTHGEGSILKTASMVGLIGLDNHAAYVASKGALIALTKAMALDYAPKGIRVNAIGDAGPEKTPRAFPTPPQPWRLLAE